MSPLLLTLKIDVLSKDVICFAKNVELQLRRLGYLQTVREGDNDFSHVMHQVLVCHDCKIAGEESHQVPLDTCCIMLGTINTVE